MQVWRASKVLFFWGWEYLALTEGFVHTNFEGIRVRCDLKAK